MKLTQQLLQIHQSLVLEFDAAGNQVSGNTTSSTLVESNTSVTFLDENGGDGGGAIINKTANISFDTDAAASEAVSAKVKDAVSYRAENGVSVTNRNDFAGAVARQRNSADYFAGGAALDGLKLFKLGSPASLTFGAATTAVGMSLERGAQSLENRSKGCNNCKKF